VIRSTKNVALRFGQSARKIIHLVDPPPRGRFRIGKLDVDGTDPEMAMTTGSLMPAGAPS
jgi:hypothetical protein